MMRMVLTGYAASAADCCAVDGAAPMSTASDAAGATIAARNALIDMNRRKLDGSMLRDAGGGPVHDSSRESGHQAQVSPHPGGGTYRPSSADSATGFTRCSSKPASRDLSLSMSCPQPVTAMIFITWLVRVRRRFATS